MNPWTRLSVGLLTGVAVLAFVAGMGRSSEHSAPLPSYWPAPEFALVDQTGAPVVTADLRGTVWVASFVFTSCADVCPAISARMARLSDDLRREHLLGERVRLVSFTVDPERDTPDVLRDYARRFGGLPPADWAFLTGSDGDALRSMIQEGFHLTAMTMSADAAEHSGHDADAARAATAAAALGYQVTHSPRLLLIDASGVVRGIYDALDDEAVGRLLPHVRRLLET